MSTRSRINLPSGVSTVRTSLINSVNFGPAQIHRFMSPAVPGLETFETSPSHSFLIEHPSGRKLVFDLGIRKDYQNYAKKVAEYLPTTNYAIDVTRNVADILEENGVDLNEIEAVVWSHWHWEYVTNHFSAAHALTALQPHRRSILVSKLRRVGSRARVQRSDASGLSSQS
jgi:glyoxylase-like metal-dependent hydrolase (beta-lactamase superfamily II)